jgi:hypothetical protein
VLLIYNVHIRKLHLGGIDGGCSTVIVGASDGQSLHF